MNPRIFVAAALAILISFISLWSSTITSAATPRHILFLASQSGQKTLDQGEGGGNPFASALIELLSRPSLSLRTLRSEIKLLTIQKSRGFQSPDVLSGAEITSWRLQPKLPKESRVALVIVFADYSASGGAPSLAGAKYDANRVSAALVGAGFQTETIIDPGRGELTDGLRRFAERSAASDYAAIYATGHGVEVDGAIYLLPGDYPIPDGNDVLKQKAIGLSQFSAAARARRANLIFYGGCRDNPFGQP